MPDWQPLPFDDEPEPAARGGPARAPLTVSALTAGLKTLLERQFDAVFVEGEISNCRPWSSGHIYFTLKDDYAQIRAVMFRSQARQLKFKPEDGLHAIARGRISVYEVKGEYQLVVETLEPHGLGALQAAFEQRKKALAAEGLFDQARKRPLPVLPRRIGIVTSADGAALRDILRVLSRRHPGARVVVRPARVQGDDAPADLLRALRAIAKVPEVDVIIIGRGGGSAEDLWAFNDERLARAIAACPVPVIAAVGHEVDFTIACFVADVRAATPSHAAELVVERADHFRRRIDDASRRLERALAGAMQARRYDAGDLRTRLARWPERVALRDRDVLEAGRRMAHALAARLAQVRQRADALDRRLARRDVRRVMADRQARIVQADTRLRALTDARRHAAERRLAGLAAGLQALSPLAVLGRGYALCWNDARTSIIRAADHVRAGDRVRVTLASGELGCRVEDTGTP